MNEPEKREERALEALIVSRLRPRGGNEIDPKKLPVLSEEEKASLNCLKPGFIQKLINLADTYDEEDDCDESEQEACDRELIHGFNRAEEIDEGTDDELRQRRQEMLDRLKKEEDERGDRPNG
jgi:hypothetical protein